MGTFLTWIREHAHGLDETTLEARVNYGITRAREAGYRDPAAIRLYVLLMFALDPRFDERARFRQYLESASGSLDERLLKMAAWSHPNIWLRSENPEWPNVRVDAVAMEWPGSDVVPAQLDTGYGFQIDVPQYATPEPIISRMLDLAQAGPDDLLVDLGCGDGRIAIAAVKRFGLRARGIDIDPARIDTATQNAQSAGVAHLVSFQREDLLDTDLTGATIVMLYLLGDINLLIRERLRSQLRPGARVISRSFDMGDWQPDTVLKTDLGPIYRWVV
jgi:SAM-dependent methyltransferase